MDFLSVINDFNSNTSALACTFPSFLFVKVNLSYPELVPSLHTGWYPAWKLDLEDDLLFGLYDHTLVIGVAGVVDAEIEAAVVAHPVVDHALSGVAQLDFFY